MTGSYSKILICRTDRIGDVILTLPVITYLRMADKKAHITFLGAEYSRKVLQNNPYLDEFIVYEPKGRHAGLAGLFTLAAEMRRAKFDTVLHIFPRFKVSLAAFLAGIRVRVGPAARWYSFLYNKKLNIHRSRVEKHELEYNLDYLAPLKVPLKDKKIKLWLTQKKKNLRQISLNQKNFPVKWSRSTPAVLPVPGITGAPPGTRSLWSVCSGLR